MVDTEGYVNVRRIGILRPISSWGAGRGPQTKDRIDIYDGARRVASHKRVLNPSTHG